MASLISNASLCVFCFRILVTEFYGYKEGRTYSTINWSISSAMVSIREEGSHKQYNALFPCQKNESDCGIFICKVTYSHNNSMRNTVYGRYRTASFEEKVSCFR